MKGGNEWNPGTTRIEKKCMNASCVWTLRAAGGLNRRIGALPIFSTANVGAELRERKPEGPFSRSRAGASHCAHRCVQFRSSLIRRLPFNGRTCGRPPSLVGHPAAHTVAADLMGLLLLPPPRVGASSGGSPE